jgi:hypothetical protein
MWALKDHDWENKRESEIPLEVNGTPVEGYWFADGFSFTNLL